MASGRGSAIIIFIILSFTVISAAFYVYSCRTQIDGLKYTIYRDVRDNTVLRSKQLFNETVSSLNRGNNESAAYFLSQAILLHNPSYYATPALLSGDYERLHLSVYASFTYTDDRLLQIRDDIYSGNVTEADLLFLDRCDTFFWYLFTHMSEPKNGSYTIDDLDGVIHELGELSEASN